MIPAEYQTLSYEPFANKTVHEENIWDLKVLGIEPVLVYELAAHKQKMFHL